MPERVLTGSWPRTFRLALLDKDVGIACRLLADVNVPAHLLEVVSRLLSTARSGLGEEADYLEVIKLVEGAAGAGFGADDIGLAAVGPLRSVSGPMRRTIQ